MPQNGQIPERNALLGEPNYLERSQLRRKVRLPDFDYSQAGAYFVTICARRRHDIFGEIVNGLMVCNPTALVVKRCWDEIPAHFSNVAFDAFVVMPNHVHGILLFANPVGAGHARPLPVVIGSFKSAASKCVGIAIWQRSYWERVIRNEEELNTLRHYIDENPFHWSTDKEFLA